MKHLKYWPFLIAAVSYVPRVHAVEAAPAAEPSTLSMLLVCVGLIVLAAVCQRRSRIIKLEE